jgi:hypothetical protein
MSEEKPQYQVIVVAAPNEEAPREWRVMLATTIDEEGMVVPLTVPEARTFAREVMKAAEYAEVQNIGEENAEALGATEPPPEEKTDGQS